MEKKILKKRVVLYLTLHRPRVNGQKKEESIVEDLKITQPDVVFRAVSGSF